MTEERGAANAFLPGFDSFCEAPRLLLLTLLPRKPTMPEPATGWSGLEPCNLREPRKHPVFVEDLLWRVVWGTFGWPFLVGGSSNSVRSATLRLEPWGGGLTNYCENPNYAQQKHPY